MERTMGWYEERIEKFLKNDVDFININLYSNQTKWEITDELIKKNKM